MTYKLLYSINVKYSNMSKHQKRAFLIVLGSIIGGLIFTILNPIPVWSIDWDLNTIYNVNSSETLNTPNLRAFYNPDFDKWYITFDTKIGRMDNNVTTVDYGFYRFKGSVAGLGNCAQVSCSFFRESGHNYTDCITRQCKTVGNWLGRGSVTYNNLAGATTMNSGESPVSTIDWVSISNDGVKMWKSGGAQAIYYCLPDQQVGTVVCGSTNYTGTLYFPTIMSDHTDEHLVKADNDYYYMFYRSQQSGTWQIYYNLYDSSYNYQSYSSISADESTNFYRPQAYMTENGIAVTFFSITNTTYGFVFIDYYAIREDNNLLQYLERESFNPSNVILNVNQTRQPYLTNDGSKYWLFYTVYETPNYVGIYAISENLTEICQKGAWVNTSVCLFGKRKQTRWVSPANCDETQRWVNDSICAIIPEGEDVTGYQRTERFCEISEPCYSEWVDPKEYSSASCKASIDISTECESNIDTDSVMTTEIEWIAMTERSQAEKRFNMLFCHPLYNCYEKSVFCELGNNQTISNSTYDHFYAGATATGHFEITNADNCKSSQLWGLLWYGWDKYRVSGTTSYCCDRICGGYKCQKRGIVWYRIEQNPDCSLNETSKVECEYGCEDGECITQEDIAPLVREPSGNPFEWIKTEAEYTFPMFILNALAFIFSIMIGIYAHNVTKSWIMGVGGLMGGIAFFLILGWLPQFVGLIWIISLGLLVANFISKHKTK